MVLTWVSTYGYSAIFVLLVLGIVGVPVPDETLLISAGYLVSRGRLHPAGAFFAALAGSWCGVSLSYLIGRTLGLGAVHRFGKYMHLTEDRLAKVHRWFERAGHWALFFGYFILGIRHVTAIVAGTSKLEFRSFALYAWSGGVFWVATFIGLGYFFGERSREIAELIHRYVGWGSLVVLVVGGAIFLWHRRLHQMPRHEP